METVRPIMQNMQLLKGVMTFLHWENNYENTQNKNLLNKCSDELQLAIVTSTNGRTDIILTINKQHPPYQ